MNAGSGRAGTPTLRAIAGNSVWLLADRITRMAVGTVMGIAIARHLGPEEFGRFEFAMAWVALFSPLTTLGLETIAVREMIRRPADQAAIAVACLRLRLMGGAIALAASGLAMAWYRPENNTLTTLVLILGCGFAFQAADAYDYLLQARMKNGVVVKARGIGFVLATLFRLVLLTFDAGVEGFAMVNTFELALAGLALRMTSSTTPMTNETSCLLTMRRLLADSWPYAGSSLMIMAYMKLGQLILENLGSIDALGKYSLALRLAEAWYFVPTALVTAAFPAIIAAREASMVDYRRRLDRLYRLLAILGYAFAITVTFLAPWLISALFGPTYAGAEVPLAILSWSGIFVGLGVARSAHLTAMNWTRFHLFSVTLGSLTSAILGWLLVPHHGATGAAIATLAAYFVASHLACLFDKELWPTAKSLFMAMIPLPPSFPRRSAG